MSKDIIKPASTPTSTRRHATPGSKTKSINRPSSGKERKVAKHVEEIDLVMSEDDPSYAPQSSSDEDEGEMAEDEGEMAEDEGEMAEDEAEMVEEEHASFDQAVRDDVDDRFELSEDSPQREVEPVKKKQKTASIKSLLPRPK